MAEIKHTEALSELKDLRAWRAFLVEACGRILPLGALRFALSLPLEDALSALGLGGSVWARERWTELRAGLDEPVELAPSAEVTCEPGRGSGLAA